MTKTDANYIHSYLLKIVQKSNDDFEPLRCGLLTFEHQGCKNFSKNSTIGKEGQ